MFCVHVLSQVYNPGIKHTGYSNKRNSFAHYFYSVDILGSRAFSFFTCRLHERTLEFTFEKIQAFGNEICHAADVRECLFRHLHLTSSDRWQPRVIIEAQVRVPNLHILIRKLRQ